MFHAIKQKRPLKARCQIRKTSVHKANAFVLVHRNLCARHLSRSPKNAKVTLCYVKQRVHEMTFACTTFCARALARAQHLVHALLPVHNFLCTRHVSSHAKSRTTRCVEGNSACTNSHSRATRFVHGPIPVHNVLCTGSSACTNVCACSMCFGNT